MPVQVDDTSSAAPPRANDVDARMLSGVLWTAVRGVIFDLETAAGQLAAEKPGARLVLFSRRIDGRNAHERLCERDDLVRRAIDLRHDSVGGMHARSGLA